MTLVEVRPPAAASPDAPPSPPDTPDVRGRRRRRRADDAPDEPIPPGLRTSLRLPVVLGTGSAAATVVMAGWFDTGRFFASGDVAPMVRASLRYEWGWQWTHQNTGAGGPTYEMSRAPEALATWFGHLVGLGEAFGQRLLYGLVWGCAAAAMAALIARVATRAWVCVVGALAVVFSMFVMVAIPNPLPTVAIGVCAAMTAMAIDTARGRRRTLGFVAATLPVSYLSINLPLVAVLLAWAVALPLVGAAVTGTGRTGARRVATALLLAAPLAVLVSLWWIVPMAFALLRARATGTVLAVTDPFAWAWTQRRSSIPHVLNGTSHWSWPMPEVYGPAAMLASPWVNWTTWVMPLAALSAPVLARPRLRRPARWLLVVLAPLVVVGKGLHPPLSELNAWLYRNVPGFFLLREPNMKVGVPQFVVTGLLFALALDGTAARLRPPARALDHVVAGRRHRFGRGVVEAVLGLAVAAPTFAAWPLLTGWAVKPDERVALPAAWHDTARLVNESPRQGKALVLPLVDYYQVPTTWGFYGADVYVRQLVTRPVLARNPENYIGDSPGYDALMRGAERAIADGDTGAAAKLLRSLGISHVLVRRDLDFDDGRRRLDIRPPEPLAEGLRRVPGMRQVATTEVADVFEFDDPAAGPVSVIGGLLLTDDVPADDLAAAVAGVPVDLAAADDARLLTRGHLRVTPAGGGTVTIPATGRWTVQRLAGDGSLVAVTPTTREDGTGAVVVTDAVGWQVGRTPVPGRPPVELAYGPGRLVGVDLGGLTVDLDGPRVVRLTGATTLTPLVMRPGDGRLGPFGPLGDCHRYDERDATQAGLSLERRSDRSGVVLELAARAHAACTSAESAVTPGEQLGLVVESRSLSGRPARVCLWFPGSRTCAPLGAPQPLDDGWVRYAELVTVPEGESTARLYLYADEPSPSDGVTTTVTQYRAAALGPVERSASATVDPATPPAFLDLDAGPVAVTAPLPVPAVSLGEASGVGDCYRARDLTPEQAGLRAERLDAAGSLARWLLAADANSACISQPVDGLQPQLDYRMTVRSRALGGAAPRLCLWDGARCLARVALSASADWVTSEVRFRQDGSSAVAPRLYLYADATSRPTVAEYEVVAIEPMLDERLLFTRITGSPAATPRITWSQDGPARYQVRAGRANGPFVLALADSFSTDWRLRGLPEGATVEPVEIDGYRQGWVVTSPRPMELTIDYAPARWGRAALAVSAAVLLGLAIAAAAAGVRRRRRPDDLPPSAAVRPVEDATQNGAAP